MGEDDRSSASQVAGVKFFRKKTLHNVTCTNRKWPGRIQFRVVRENNDRRQQWRIYDK